MHVETLYQVAGIVGGSVAFLTLVTMALRWFYRRGGTEREYKIALDANTESNKELTGAVGKVVDKLTEHDKRIDHLDWRVERLEAAPSVHVSVSPDRNASTPG